MASNYSATLSPSDAISTPAVDGPGRGTRSGMQSRRASNQSKELSSMELPEPSWLKEQTNSSGVNPKLLSPSDVESSPFVRSIPSSPYLGAASSPGTNSSARFEDTQSDDIADKWAQLDLPEPEVLKEGNKRDQAEREREAQELAEVMDKLDLPDPEYITRASMKASGAKTPEPTPRQEGSAQLVRSLSQKLKHLQQQQRK